MPRNSTSAGRLIPRPPSNRAMRQAATNEQAFQATVAGLLPADVSGAVSLTKNDNGRGNAADGGPSAVPPSAHAERTFNHTPNAHGDVTQRQSAGFASRKLSVQIASSPPIPKCPSLRMAMAEMPMSGARGCDQLAKRLTRWQMRGLDGNDCTVCIQECQICRIVPQPSIAHGAALCGKFHGVCRDGRETPSLAKKWPPLRAAGIAFWNGAKARRAVHGCVKEGHSGSASASISVVRTQFP